MSIKVHIQGVCGCVGVCMCHSGGAAENITLGFTLLRSLSFCFCSSNWRLFLSSSKSFCCCSNRFLREKQPGKEQASGTLNCVIFIFPLTISAIDLTFLELKTTLLIIFNFLMTILFSHYINLKIYEMSL